MIYWDRISLVLSGVIIGYDVINESSRIFSLFSEAWTQARNNEEIWDEIQQKLSDEELASIYKFTNKIDY